MHRRQTRIRLDTIGLPETVEICAKALALHANEGQVLRYTSSLPLQSFPRDDVVKDDILAYTVTGEAFEKCGIAFPALPEKYAFGSTFWELTATLVNEGKLLPHPVEIREGGLSGIIDG